MFVYSKVFVRLKIFVHIDKYMIIINLQLKLHTPITHLHAGYQSHPKPSNKLSCHIIFLYQSQIMMHAGSCEQIKPFNFYSLEEFEYKQLISRSKYFVGLYEHIETKMAVIVKEIAYSQCSLEVLKHVQKIKSNNLATLLGLCLHRAEVGWTEGQRLKVEDNREREERKQSRTLLLFMEKSEMNLLEYVALRRRNIQMFTVQEIRVFVNQMLSILEKLQREGIAHRDIKPQNILVHHQTYLLCDFQDAIQVKLNQKPGIDLTTVEYSSPEFLRFIRHPKDKYFDPFKLDVYSFGLSLLYLCSMGKFSLEERANYIYQSSQKSHQDFMKDQRTKWIRNQGQYKTFNSFVKMMLEQDEYKRDDFVTLMIKNIGKNQGDDNSSDYNLSDDNSKSKSSAKLHKLQRKKFKKLAKQKKQDQLKARQLKVYGGLTAIMIVIFVVYCLL